MNLIVRDFISSGATLNPADAGNLNYTSSDEKVVKIVDGMLLAVGKGNATITVNFDGDDKYLAAENKTIDVSVSMTESSMEVLPESQDIFAGEDAIITVILPSDATGIVFVDVGDKKYYANVEKGNAIVIADCLSEGNYTVNVTYPGDEKYFNSTGTAAIEVVAVPVPVNPQINLTVADVKVGEEAHVIVELPDDANSNIRGYIDGNYAFFFIVYRGTLNISLGELPAGKHHVGVVYSGNTKYMQVLVSKDFNVEKLTTDVTADPVEITEGETAVVTVNVDANATGAVVVDVGGNKYYADVENGTAGVIVDGLTAGNYTAEVVYLGDEEYFNSTGTAAIEVVALPVPVNPQINLTVADVKVGEEARVIVELPDDANGNIRGYIDGNDAFFFIVYRGTLNISLGELPAGKHHVGVVYSGNTKYMQVLVSKDFNVEKLTTDVTADPVEITEGETAVVTVNVDANATGAVVVDVGGNKYYADVENGTAGVIVAGLTAGNYTADVIYLGDENYDEAIGTVGVKVDAKPAFKSQSSIEIVEVNGYNITGILMDSEGKGIANAPITYAVNGTSATTTTADDGSFIIEVVNGAKVDIEYAGNETVLPANLTLTFNVPDVPVVVKTVTQFNISNRAITINGYAVDGPANEQGIYYATTLLDANGKPVSNVYIEFAVNNKIYNRTTYENGSFKPYKLNMVRAGRYTMAFNFAGDDNYTNAFACVCVDLDKKPITIKAPAKTYKVATKIKKYTVTLSTIKGLDGKMYLSPKKVSIKVNGKTYTAKTNSKGVAQFKITNLNKKAKYKATITYAGDKTYESASKTVTLTVK